MQLIVPAAGLGQRFADAGYSLPKPLVEVSGLPMIVRVVRDLPTCEWIAFVVHAEHVRRFAIDSVLRAHFPQCRVVVAPGLTAGQACTVRLAAEAIDLDDDVLVAACDATHVYDAADFERVRSDATVDACVWTYRGEPRVLAKPQSFGWVAADAAGNVERVSCKWPISDNLLADRVASGFFWFRSARRMMGAIDELVADDERVSNEFYLDVVPNRFIAAGRRVVAFDVAKYIGWGTPEDLQDYRRWERYFAQLARAQVHRKAS